MCISKKIIFSSVNEIHPSVALKIKHHLIRRFTVTNVINPRFWILWWDPILNKFVQGQISIIQTILSPNSIINPFPFKTVMMPILSISMMQAYTIRESCRGGGKSAMLNETG